MTVRKIYQNTIKTILRSNVFRLSALVVILTTVYTVWHRYQLSGIPDTVVKYYLPLLSPEDREAFILDWYSLSRWKYIQLVSNTFSASLLWDAIPIFTVIVTASALNSDYGDQFFEIEKSANVTPSQYLLGRICAITTVPLALTFVWGLVLLHAQVIVWGGATDMSLGTYLLDSAFRVLRMTIVGALPSILFFVGIVYLAGTLFRSGLVGAVAGFGFVIFDRVMITFWNYLVIQNPTTLGILYFDCLRHYPYAVRDYLMYFRLGGVVDPDGASTINMVFSTPSLGKTLFSIGFLLCVFTTCTAVSYVKLRKREI